MKASKRAWLSVCLALCLLAAVGSSAWAQCPPPVPYLPPFDLGSVAIGTTSAPRDVGFTCGGGPCFPINAVIVGPNAAEFTITGNACSVPYTGHCPLTVTFTPAACGLRVAFMVFSTNVTVSQDGTTFPAGCPYLIYTLTGTGVATPVVGPPLTFPGTAPGTTGGCITLTIPA